MKKFKEFMASAHIKVISEPTVKYKRRGFIKKPHKDAVVVPRAVHFEYDAPKGKRTRNEEAEVLGFKDYLEEAKDPSSTTYHAFDIDETLFAHDPSKLRVHLKDKNTGERVGTLTNQEFNTHKLHPDHEYDFSEFKSSKTFQQSAHPIRKMISKLKAIHKNNKNVEMVTARQDFDDKEAFGNHFKKYGIDIGQVHVRRAGNVDPKASPGPNKAKVISDQIQKNGYKKVHLYDDSQSNLDHFLALKDKHPDVAFHAHLVQHDPETDKVKITTTKA